MGDRYNASQQLETSGGIRLPGDPAPGEPGHGEPGHGGPGLVPESPAWPDPLAPPAHLEPLDPGEEAEGATTVPPPAGGARSPAPHAPGKGGKERHGRRAARARRSASSTTRDVLRGIVHRQRIVVQGGAVLHLLVLACTHEDTVAVDLASGAVLRLRVDWPAGHRPDLVAFDVVEATLADDPQRDDLAQPEAASAAGLPRQVGTLRGRRVRKLLDRLEAVPDGPLLGFPGPAAPYWEFRGARPSVALIEPTRGPQLLRRRSEGSTWVRFGWDREDVWLPVEDPAAIRALDAARRDRLSGKDLAAALGFRPDYLLATVSRPRDGHCYKVLTAILPRG